MQKYVFLYFLTANLDKTRMSLGDHVQYWKNLALGSQENGPFADRSGGLIIFTAANLEEATALVVADPLLKADAVQQYWVKEWVC